MIRYHREIWRDPQPDAAWQIWYQDAFDPECPRQMESSGCGLARGLQTLWSRFLAETVRPDGTRGFSRFNLWWQEAGQSVTIEGEWQGAVRLRSWIFNISSQGTHPSFQKGGRRFLYKLVSVHAHLLLNARSSVQLLEAAAIYNREDFERWLEHTMEKKS